MHHAKREWMHSRLRSTMNLISFLIDETPDARVSGVSFFAGVMILPLNPGIPERTLAFLSGAPEDSLASPS